MTVESLKANQGIYKALSKLTKKDYYKTPTGVIIKTDKGKGSVSYNKETGEITCDGLENAIIDGTLKADKITVQNSKNVKVAGGLGNDEFTIKYSDTVEVNGGFGDDKVILYDNPKNVKLKNVEKETNIKTPEPTPPPTPEPTPLPTPEPTTPKEPERDGIIDGFKQGDVSDSKFFAQLLAMSQTEAGAQIIKDSITWDDENRQAIVHCKGLGVDVTVSYERLEYARENGQSVSEFDSDTSEFREYTKQYSSGDDDILLLELVMNDIDNIVSASNIPSVFKCADNQGAFNPYTFLAGVKYDTNYIFDPREINNILKELEEDNGQKLVSNASLKFNGPLEVKDVYGNVATLDPKQTYAIKEVKDGLVTIINPQDATGASPLTQTFTYEEFSKHFNITKPTDIEKASDIALEVHILEDSDLECLLTRGITPTTAKVVKSGERNGEIERSSQGGIGDCWYLSEVNAMSYSEEGRKIIKESIEWDDENRQAIVHCKGLGIDMVVSYDELAEAEKNGNKYYHDEGLDDIGGHYSYGDDDVFLLEYVMAKLDYLEDNKLIDFEAIGSRPSLYAFLAGAETQSPIKEEAQIKEFLDKLEADGGKNLVATAATSGKISEDAGMFGLSVTDANGKKANLAPNHAYAIKEVKNGLVTVVNPWDSGDESKWTQTFTYDEFCKYFDIHSPADLSKTTDKTPAIVLNEGAQLSDYGISLTTGNVKISDFKSVDKKIIDNSKMSEYCTFGTDGNGSYWIGTLVRDDSLIGSPVRKYVEPSQTLDMAKEVLKKDDLSAFQFTDKDGLIHLFVNNNGNIRYYTTDGSEPPCYKLVEEKEMTADEFRNYAGSIIDSQEYIKGYNVYSDYKEPEPTPEPETSDEPIPEIFK